MEVDAIDIVEQSQSTEKLLPADFKKRPPLSDDELQKILANLRPEGKSPFIIQMPPPGQDIMPVIRQHLQAQGYSRTHFFKRAIDASRLPQAITTGTDRDKSSEIDTKEWMGDGESLAMIENGLDPSTDRDLVTYMHDLDLKSNDVWLAPKNISHPILIYAPDALQYIKPSDKPGKTYNGFAMFKDRRIMNRALLAVVSPAPMDKVAPQGPTNG